MLATHEAHVIPPIWMKHLECVFFAASASPCTSFSFLVEGAGDEADFCAHGGLFAPDGTSKSVSIYRIREKKKG